MKRIIGHYPRLNMPADQTWLINIACFVSHFLVSTEARVLSTFRQYPPPPILLLFILS